MTLRPQGVAEIRELLARHDVHPSKRLGQHFLADPNIVDRIVRFAEVGAADRIVEIGAGTGTMTRALAATGAHVVSFEVDDSLRPILEETLDGAGVDLRFRDAMTADLEAELEGSPWKLVANLPYNVGTPLLLDMLRHVPKVTRFVVMLQREVADRLVAGPGSKQYGVPSVIARLYATIRFGFGVPPQVFVPPPEVASAVVRLDRIPVDASAAEAERLALAAFGQRRKMLRRSLAGAVADPARLLRTAGIAETARAEELAVDDYLRLARAVS